MASKYQPGDSAFLWEGIRNAVSRFFLTWLSICGVIFKRIRFNLGLTISAEIGIIAILTLVVTIPLFTNAILSQILHEQLREKATRNGRSLFSLHAYYLDQNNYSPVTVEGANAVAAYLRQEFEERMGLSVERVVMELTTRQLLWEPVKTRSTSPPFQYLYLSLLSNDLLPQGANFVEGAIPKIEDFRVTNTDQNAHSIVIPVAVHERLADENFINVGDIYRSKPGIHSDEFSIEVVGIFRAKDPHDRGWFYSPDTTFNSAVWVPVEIFREVLPDLLERPQNATSWYAIVSDENLRFNRSRLYSHQMVRIDTGLKSMAPTVRIDYSPLDMLQAYEKRLQAVTILFFAAGVPMIVLALLFTSLTASIAVQQTITETVTMRTRGMGVVQALWMNLSESLILIGVAIPLVVGLSWLGAILIGQSQSFLKFDPIGNPDLSVINLQAAVEPASIIEPANPDHGGIPTRSWISTISLRDIHLGWAGIMILVIILARAAPFLSLWRNPVIDLKQRMARQTTNRTSQPLWKRAYLDFIFLALSVYVYLTYRGMITPVGGIPNLGVPGGGGASDPIIRPDLQFSYDPLILLSASFFAIACCMISLRLLPLFLQLFQKVFNRISQPWGYLAYQEIVRNLQDHANILLLIMIALSLSIYSASMARTLSLWMYQSRAYQSGADLVIREFEIDFSSGFSPANSAQGGSSANNQSASGQANSTIQSQNVVRHPLSLVSLDRHLDLPEIEHFSYVGEFNCRYSYAEASPSLGEKECRVMGIDRLTFPDVAFFRRDFASGDIAPSLGAMMNAIAAQPFSVLAPQSMLEQTGLAVGDTIRLKVLNSDLGLNFSRDMIIAGSYHYFPTIYPADARSQGGSPTLVMSLETLFGSYDAIVDYDVWLKLQSGASSSLVLQKIQELALKDRMGIRVLQDSLAAIEAAKSQPEWTGLFGVLNLGFFLTGLMPGIGFVLYSFASLRKRTIQLGILQAIGLSFKQLIGSLLLEQLVLMSIAIVIGMLVGYLSSLLFLPILQVSIGAGEPVPPFQVEVGWSESGWLSLYFFTVLSLTIAWTIIYLARMKIFQAVKLGESIS
jgi:putative ABC transport system permease protein